MLGRSDGVDEERAVKKILIVLTNTAAYGERNVATGLWLGEAAEFMDEAIQRGYAVDFVSPKGGYVPLDPRSMKPAYVDRAAFALYRTRDFQERALAHSMHPDDVDPGEYVALYYTGGHGVMWDFPSSEGLERLCLEVYGNDVTNKVLRDKGLDLIIVPSAELSRGRGGPRCMSMPIERED